MTGQTHNTELAKQLYSSGNGETATPSSTPPSTSESKPKSSESFDDRRRRVMVALWARMTAMFPQWESLYGNVDSPGIAAWTRNLDGFTELELGGAIRLSERWEGKFPPMYPEFRAMCVNARNAAKPDVTAQRLAEEKAAGQSATMIEHLSRIASGPTALAELERMHRLMAGEEVETFQQSFHACGLGSRWPNDVSARAK